jgi:hypothetical protein
MKASVFFMAFIMALIFTSGFAQKTARKSEREQNRIEKQKQIEALVNSKEFVFEATYALPQGGKSIYLTGSSYTVKFHPDTIESYLPFFGRAYSVDYGGEGGIKFCGRPTEFNVVTRKAEKGYDINATIKAPKDYYKLHLSVSSVGSATLIVDSNQRSSISYQGDIAKFEEVKGK